ncbi:hypothetical protein [Chitinophaga barathri]|uniref:Peptidase M4 n=1 Tax=Chitinophaga barathri TaxID=1647451 RepID=A0A3N4MKD0_9BACT|nr:hypothetical protein [Chitinophaga barathri]RPD42377.1 hypothetical protein EG028_04150 [Chitinophaga barathri]
MNVPPYRLLRGYSLDPAFSTRLDTMGINEVTYKVPWESLAAGPCGAYFEVIDYDPPSNCWYEPVDLNHTYVLAQNGLPPSEGNPQFHQQFVYTIAMRTLVQFERSLSRKIIWNPRVTEDESDPRKKTAEYVRALRLYPHAYRASNAYYDPEKRAVLFGYFEAGSKVREMNMPGGVIFTCLSPDIIAHELTHALLDTVHPRFIENTNPDVAAFHEGFADIVALMQRFTIPSLIEHQIAQTRGNLRDFSFLGELATQFGNALENNHGALRSAIGKINSEGKWERMIPDPSLYKTEFKPHKRGAILVATIFDAFLRLYTLQTEDLIRIATNGTGVLQPGAIHPDLVKRLAREACEIADHLLHICIRALDYCPPLDINYGDYLRAVISADLDISPVDTNGYRVALIEAFRSWGIFPETVTTLSVESLRWEKTDQLDEVFKNIWNKIAQTFREPLREIIDISQDESRDRREEIVVKSVALQARLHTMLLEKGGSRFNEEFLKRYDVRLTDEQWSAFMETIGVIDKKPEFKYNGKPVEITTKPKIEIHKIRPVFRVGREGRILEQMLITITQKIEIETGELKGATFRGGSTIILNLQNQMNVDCIIYKRISSAGRFERQMDFQTGSQGNFSFNDDSMYEDDCGFVNLSFSHLHSNGF